MIIKKTFRFEKLTDWNHEIDVSANFFHEKFNVWPNILMTNEPTFRRIDFLANRKQENIRNAGMKIEDKLFVSLGGYDSKRYHLDFYTKWLQRNNLEFWVPSYGLIV